MNENTLTNLQVQQSLKNINLLLGQIEVSGEGVMHMADSRRALTQVIEMIKIEEDDEIKA